MQKAEFECIMHNAQCTMDPVGGGYYPFVFEKILIFFRLLRFRLRRCYAVRFRFATLGMTAAEGRKCMPFFEKGRTYDLRSRHAPAGE